MICVQWRKSWLIDSTLIISFYLPTSESKASTAVAAPASLDVRKLPARCNWMCIFMADEMSVAHTIKSSSFRQSNEKLHVAMTAVGRSVCETRQQIVWLSHANINTIFSPCPCSQRFSIPLIVCCAALGWFGRFVGAIMHCYFNLLQKEQIIVNRSASTIIIIALQSDCLVNYEDSPSRLFAFFLRTISTIPIITTAIATWRTACACVLFYTS